MQRNRRPIITVGDLVTAVLGSISLSGVRWGVVHWSGLSEAPAWAITIALWSVLFLGIKVAVRRRWPLKGSGSPGVA
jgi:hypothetical protein